ncbi:mus101 [Drosophila busckii]|uniref:Mus101 n=1 Tax=Drosophila busckii TaxID=30019 RepID=A0A0M4EVJ2_DROBS|nr:DNA topoisomerase 2-binding protein 1-B [Drosophila busckii]ALC49297.1 mus101 [Drosophila busckii]
MSAALDETICAYFVNNCKGQTESEKAALVQYEQALTVIREVLADTQLREIKPSHCAPLIAGGGLTKKDVFVLAQFEGDLFEQLQASKAQVLGPPCIVECVRKCEPIPLGSSAVYSTAMSGLQISASGINSQEKDELKKLINWMGGHYFQNFGRNVTHLISNTIKSNKYEHATLNGVPVMHVDWVHRVWDCSRADASTCAADKQFDKYRLPTFFNANITCSGLECERKDAIMRLVNENGGIYHRAFRSQLVDIVITEQSKTDTEKYKAALRFKKDILLPEWIFDSQERGYALPTKQYLVRPRKQVSTPTKPQHRDENQTLADTTQLTDISRISFISAGRRMGSDLSTVNETLSSNSGGGGGQLIKQATSQASQLYQQTLAEICPRRAKQAGAFLDGCCIYLSGFRAAERAKLNQVLNTGGAIRFDEPREGLTHIIVGQLAAEEYNQWQCEGLLGSVQLVRLDWLLECLNAGRIVSELPHRWSMPHAAGAAPDAASPASKRTLRSMNHSFKQPLAPRKQLFQQQQPEEQCTLAPEPEPEPELLTHYSQPQEPATPLPMASSTQLIKPPAEAAAATASGTLAALAYPDLSASTLSIDFDKLDYLTGTSVYVHEASFSSELYDQLISECKAAQALLVPPSYADPVDYAIASFEQLLDPATLPLQARHVVTELYLESCMKQNKLLLPPEYYHLPVPYNARRRPLQGLTIVVSIYAGLERDFVNTLAELLGAQLNKVFVKRERPLLVCSNPEGSKYEGALKWNFPVVTAHWLLECAERGEKLPFVGHLVGSSASDFPQSPAQRQSSRQRESETPQPTPTPAPAAEPEPVAAPELTPLRNPRVAELVTGQPKSKRRSSSGSGSSTPDSPHTPVQQRYNLNSPLAAGGACNFEFLEQVAQRLDTSAARNCVRQIIHEMREHQTPELERFRRQACTPVNRRSGARAAPGIPNFCLTPEFQQRMADDFERRWRLPKQQIKPDTPLAVIRQRVMRITCETLGIDYEEQEQQELPEQKQSEEEEQATQRRSKRSKPEPALGRLIFETETQPELAAPASPLVLATQSPRRSSAAGAAQAPDELASTINFDKISFEETTAGGGVTAAAAEAASSSDNSLELKQITDYLKSRESRRSSLKRDHDGQAKTELQYVQPFESEGFALAASEDVVGWRDPAEARRQSSNSGGSPRMRYPGTPCFSISSSEDEPKRLQLIERINALGGKVCQQLGNYDASCTHLLCERPNRGEKMLGCIAAGKWVLNIEYIEACHARGAFLDESFYEWGNPQALNLPTLSTEEQQIAAAAHRWRLDLSASGGGAFSSQRVILSLQERSLAAIGNVLQAGGATILQVHSPYSADADASSATHCYVDVKKSPLNPKDFAYLQKLGVRIMSQMCINSLLMSGRDANLDKYVLRQ